MLQIYYFLIGHEHAYEVNSVSKGLHKISQDWGKWGCHCSSGLSDPAEGKNNNSPGGAHPPAQHTLLQVWQGEIFIPFSKNPPLHPRLRYLTIITSYNLIFSDLIKYWLASEILPSSWLEADILVCVHLSLSGMSASQEPLIAPKGILIATAAHRDVFLVVTN